MDKRSILFVICVSLAFFGIQTAFSMWRDKDNGSYVQSIQAQNTLKKETAQREKTARTAKAEEFQIVELYSDLLGRKKLRQP